MFSVRHAVNITVLPENLPLMGMDFLFRVKCEVGNDRGSLVLFFNAHFLGEHAI